MRTDTQTNKQKQLFFKLRLNFFATMCAILAERGRHDNAIIEL